VFCRRAYDTDLPLKVPQGADWFGVDTSRLVQRAGPAVPRCDACVAAWPSSRSAREARSTAIGAVGTGTAEPGMIWQWAGTAPDRLRRLRQALRQQGATVLLPFL